MLGTSRRGAKEGIGFGVIAGVVFGLMEILAAAVMGDSPLMPLRAFASVVMGSSAIVTASAGSVIVVGTIVHLVLAGVFGLIYGLVNASFSSRTETSLIRQAGLGLLFGVGIWLVDFQIIARILYPWFLAMPQLLQLVMHAVFYGLPLALMYAAAERRVQHVGGAQAHA